MTEGKRQMTWGRIEQDRFPEVKIKALHFMQPGRGEGPELLRASIKAPCFCTEHLGWSTCLSKGHNLEKKHFKGVQRPYHQF